MTVVALTLLLVGVFDLVRRATSTRPRWRAALFVLDAVVAVAVGGLLLGWTVWLVVPVAASALWAWSVPDAGRARWGLWPVAGLAVIVAVGVWSSTPDQAEAVVLSARGWSLPWSSGLLVAGVLVFLLESSNLVVRVALMREHRDPPASPAPPVSSRRGLFRRHRTAAASPVVSPAPATLKGGRLIGPIERILMTALVLVGGYVLIASLIAAKGIVRFPEISRDSAEGNRAEYFLVGSMVSWTLAFAAAATLWIALFAP